MKTSKRWHLSLQGLIGAILWLPFFLFIAPHPWPISFGCFIIMTVTLIWIGWILEKQRRREEQIAMLKILES